MPMSSPTIYAFTDNDDGRDISINISPTLRCGGKNGGGTRLAIAQMNHGVAGTLAASGAGLERPAGNCNETDMLILDNYPYRVRRLTPKEAERLQGFPDDWTAVPFRNKDASDGPRYRALGNSMCVAVMQQLGEAIQNYENSLEENAA